MKTKKIVLFIVEGITDQTSLALILSKIIQNESVKFHIVNGDITSDRFTTAENAITKVNSQIKMFLDKNPYFKKSDIQNIVHLVDTDGAFVSEDKIVKGDVTTYFYTLECIISKSVDSVKERNHRKSNVINRLSMCPKISNIAYSMYYFSCNLEHVLHNEINLDDIEKMRYADQFSDAFYEREIEFIDFISKTDYAVNGSYRETWEFIKIDEHSLERLSNFHLFFQV